MIQKAAEQCSNQAMNMARTYLEYFVDKIDDPYIFSLMTYALELSGSNKGTEAFNKLLSMKRTGTAHYKRLFKDILADVNFH